MQTTGIKASMPWRHAMVALKRCYEPGLSGWLERRIEGMFFFLGDGCGTEVMYCWAITLLCWTVFGVTSCFLLHLFDPWSDQECQLVFFLTQFGGWPVLNDNENRISHRIPYVLRGFSPGVDVQRSSLWLSVHFSHTMILMIGLGYPCWDQWVLRWVYFVWIRLRKSAESHCFGR